MSSAVDCTTYFFFHVPPSLAFGRLAWPLLQFCQWVQHPLIKQHQTALAWAFEGRGEEVKREKNQFSGTHHLINLIC